MSLCRKCEPGLSFLISFSFNWEETIKTVFNHVNSKHHNVCQQHFACVIFSTPFIVLVKHCYSYLTKKCACITTNMHVFIHLGGGSKIARWSEEKTGIWVRQWKRNYVMQCMLSTYDSPDFRCQILLHKFQPVQSFIK